MATKRIEYIDAMRGFTMILVVFAHICHFCLDDSRMGYNAVFIIFRLPCFFMLSGWLFEPVATRDAGIHDDPRGLFAYLPFLFGGFVVGL